MIFLITAAVLIFGYVAAQDPGCNFKQSLVPGETYYIQKTYGANEVCRYIGVSQSGYNCRLDCRLFMPSSPGCTSDRVLVSTSGDTTLAAAKAYCGTATFTAVSSGNTIVAGIIGSAQSTGGYVTCNMTSQRVPTTPAPAQCECGIKKQTRIVGGQETQVDEYPMMATIVEKSTDSPYCGATTISNRYAVSAAHCVVGFQNPTEIYLVLGDRNIEDDNSATSYEVDKIIVHQKYDPDTYDYDIALLRASINIIFNNRVSPACLAFAYTNKDFTGQYVTILGRGSTSFGGETSDKVRKAVVQYISDAQCRAMGNNVTQQQICTYAKGKDACQFDSGGPVLFTSPESGRLILTGVISNGMMCGTGAGVNTDVVVLLPWIVNTASDTQFCFKR